MNKKSILAIVLTGVFTLGLIGCGGAATDSAKSASGDKVIKVGVTPVPHKEILDVAIPLLEKEGYKVEVTEFNDYVQPNTALADGELDANYFQTLPLIEEVNRTKGYDLVSVGQVHLEPMGMYSKKIKSLGELKDGATIAIPNDASNESRTLRLLVNAGLIKVNDGGENITPKDITENSKNLKFSELEAASIPRALDDVDGAVINGNYAIGAGFNPSKDALTIEDKNSEATKPYGNAIVVKKGNENSEKIQALKKALMSEEVKKFIEEKYSGSVIPVF